MTLWELRAKAPKTIMTDIATIQKLEAATMSAWPSISSAMDGLWLARFARGYSKRSNSIQCLDPTDDRDAEARLQRMADLYPLNSRDPLFRVTPLAGPGVIRALDSAGWQPFEESRVLAMPLVPSGSEPPARLKISEGADAAWIEAYGILSEATRKSLDTLAILIGLIAHRQAGLLIRDQWDEPLAAALAVDANGVAVFLNVVVRQNARGQGLGRQIMRAALDWTQSVGSTEAAIQVVSDNDPAIGLYTSLGFNEVYRYHYRRP
jgi:N-acetylglutamate synthase